MVASVSDLEWESVTGSGGGVGALSDDHLEDSVAICGVCGNVAPIQRAALKMTGEESCSSYEATEASVVVAGVVHLGNCLVDVQSCVCLRLGIRLVDVQSCVG